MSTWLVTGDGNNRASLRKSVAKIVSRKVRTEKRALMQHRQDIAHLRQHPLAFGDAPTRNLRKAQRKARRS